MKYDFTSILDRRGWDSFAVEAPACGKPDMPMGMIRIREGFDLIPMWVADMNFPTVPTVPEALIRRAAHPAYGYFMPRPEYYEAICRWHQQRNGVQDLKPEHIGYPRWACRLLPACSERTPGPLSAAAARRRKVLTLDFFYT